ncbi:MAG: ADP-ribosylation factor-like protein [Promethearchaeota archaeon]
MKIQMHVLPKRAFTSEIGLKIASFFFISVGIIFKVLYVNCHLVLMLRAIKIIKDQNLIFEKNFGNSLTHDNFQLIWKLISEDIKNPIFTENDVLRRYFHKYQLSIRTDVTKRLVFVFISDLQNDKTIKEEIINFSTNFLDKICVDDANTNSSHNAFKKFLNSVDNVFKRNWPKLSLAGYSGVGKTTITQLLQKNDLPVQHIPTISGEIQSFIDEESGNFCRLWDFGGQDSFHDLWDKFLRGSDLVLIITDSTIENCEKSSNLIEKIKTNAMDAIIAVIANKQDLPEALPVEKIRKIFNDIEVIPLVAMDKNKRSNLLENLAKLIGLDKEALLVSQESLDESALEAACSLDEIEEPSAILNDSSQETEKNLVLSPQLIKIPKFFGNLERWIYESWDILAWIFEKAKFKSESGIWCLSKEWIDYEKDTQFDEGEIVLVWNKLERSQYLTKTNEGYRVNQKGKDLYDFLIKNINELTV